MYQPREKHPCTRILEDNWHDILKEYQAIAADPSMHKWPEEKLYDGRWDTFGLYLSARMPQELRAMPDHHEDRRANPRQRVHGSGFRVQGSGFTVHGAGFR